MNAATWVGVALLGGLGAVARVVVTRAIAREPWIGTLVVNLAGTFALGLLVGAGGEEAALLLLGGGLLGALTTFSALVSQVVARRSPALLGAALALGLGTAALGRMIGAAL